MRLLYEPDLEDSMRIRTLAIALAAALLAPAAALAADPADEDLTDGRAPTVVQINATGPFDIVYINPPDDPSSKAGTKDSGAKK
jgi:hypothetical protein